MPSIAKRVCRGRIMALSDAYSLEGMSAHGDFDMTDIDFDTGLKQLEGIVQKLDGGQLTLEESLKIFEEGIGLVRLLAKKLDEAEKKIEILTQTDDGSVILEDFDPKGTEK